MSVRRELTVICFYRGFSCCPYYRGVRKARVDCNLFMARDLAAVRIIGVSGIAGCPQGES